MCGIAGSINCATPAELAGMVGALAHRGPDSNGMQWFEPFQSGLGHSRLSILDLSPAGHQPMVSAGGRYWITFNGEVYNFHDLRRELEARGCRFRSSSDTEVVLQAYETWGEDCLARFNGMFAFAIFDAETGRLFAARDRIGIKPFYYHHRGASFLFASEIKALFCVPAVPRRPHYEALFTPARFQISPLTGFRDIWKLPPAHCLRFENGRLSLKRYWNIEAAEDDGASEPEIADELDGLLKDAVRLQMIADRPVGTFLSGGVDSSLITALMRKNHPGDIHAFTIRFSDKDQRFERMPDDSYYARKVARLLDLKFHEFEIEPSVVDLLPRMVWHLDEPLSDPAVINNYMISVAARDAGIVVLLNGVGGDEVFGGYRKYLACLNADVYQRMFPRVVQRGFQWATHFVPVATERRGFRWLRWMKRFLSFASLPREERFLCSDLSLSAVQYDRLFSGHRYGDSFFFAQQLPTLRRPDLSYLTDMCLNDTCVFLPEHNLTYTDKTTMATGVESRPPLTDHRIVERMFRLPPSCRIRRHEQKWLFKKVAERHLPREIVYRPKAPFNAPLRSWIRGPLAGLVDDLLSETSVKSRGLYSPAYVRTLIRDDRTGRADHGMTIWTLLTTELWFRTFIDHPPYNKEGKP